MSDGCQPLQAWFDGLLRPDEHAAFEHHLAGCPQCRRAGGELVWLEMAAAELRAARQQRRRRLGWATASLGAAAAAAALVFVCLVQPPGERAEVPLQIAEVLFTTCHDGHGGVRYCARRTSTDRPDSPTSPSSSDSPTSIDTHDLDDPRHSGSLAGAHVMRGGGTGVEPLRNATLAELGHRRDARPLASVLALAARYDEAERTLVAGEDSPEVRSDRAAVALLRGLPEDALALADSVPADALHPQALWNRAVALRNLGLPLLAGATFARVAEALPSWRDRAVSEAERSRSEALRRRAGWRDAWEAGEAMVKGGPPLAEQLVQRHPGISRLLVYDALRVAPSSERARALRPLGEQLDRIYGGAALRRLTERVVGADFVVRAPLAADYQRLRAGQLGLEGSALDAWLKRVERSGQDDILLGALVQTDLVTAPERPFRRLAERSGDPWFPLIGDDQQAGLLLVQGRNEEAAQLLRSAIDRCRPTRIADKCGVLQTRQVRLLRDEGSVVQARRLAQSALAEARTAGAWNLEQTFLGYLAQLEAGRGAYGLAHAYLDEAELALLDPRDRATFATRDDEVARFLHQQRALFSIEEMRPDEARAELKKAEATGRPMRADALQALAELARWELSKDDIARGRRRIAELREEPHQRPDVLAQLDVVEGRLLSATDPAAASPYLERALAARVEGNQTAMATTRALAFATLVDLAGMQGRWDEALGLIARELEVKPPGPCSIGVSLDLDRLLVVARDPEGTLLGRRGQLDRRDPKESPATERVVPADVLSALASCPSIAVYGRAPLQGLARLLPAERAWSYRAGPGTRRVAGATGPRRRVVVSGAIPPAWLQLPPLAPLMPLADPGEELVLLDRAAAAPSRVLPELVDADEIEFHVHGLFDVEVSDASLALTPDADGTFALGAAALEKQRLHRAPWVILGSCRAAGAAPTRRQPRSLPIALLRAGASAVFASPAPLSDRDAGRFFDDLRRLLQAGAAPAEALRDARLHALDQGLDPSMMDVLLFD